MTQLICKIIGELLSNSYSGFYKKARVALKIVGRFSWLPNGESSPVIEMCTATEIQLSLYHFITGGKFISLIILLKSES